VATIPRAHHLRSHAQDTSWTRVETTILGHHIELKGQNPYGGGVTSGWITLEAPLLSLSIVGNEELALFFGNESSDILLIRMARSSLPGSFPLFDLIGFEKASAALIGAL